MSILFFHGDQTTDPPVVTFLHASPLMYLYNLFSSYVNHQSR